MRILITGGKGFIGSHCVEHFLEQGDDVLVIDHQRAGIYYNAKYVSLNMAYDTEALCEFIDAFMPEAVIHLAAWSNVRESMDNPSKLYAYNVQATANLIDVLLGGEPAPIVFASSSAADNPESHYGVSKLACEKMLEIYGHQTGCPVACLRFGNVYGLRQNPRHGTLIAKGIERLMNFLPIEIYGDGSQERDYIHVKDICRAVEICIHAELSGIHNISTGILTSTQEVVDRLRCAFKHECGDDAPVPKYLPARLGDKQTVELTPSSIFEDARMMPPTRMLQDMIMEQMQWRLDMSGSSWDYPLNPKGENIVVDTTNISSLDQWLRLGGRL